MKAGYRMDRGVTLVELLVAIVVAGLVLAGISAVLVQNQRITMQSREQVSAQQTVRAGVGIVSAELRELSPALGDILDLSADDLTVRTVRGAGVICAIPTRGPLTLRVRNLGRAFEDGEEVTFFVADSANIATNDYWATGTIGETMPEQACPSGAPAQDLEFSATDPAGAADGVQVGGLVRGFEVWTYSSVQYEGRTYLARMAPGADAIPLVGPIDENGGLRFAYRDAAGNTTSDPASVRSIELTVRSTSLARGEGGRAIADSLTTLIHLRN